MEQITDLPAWEVALSIHHIAHKIFSSLSTEDLFNCRLVSYNWKIFSAPSLQLRINKLKMYGFNPSSSSQSLQKQQLRRRGKSIQELITLLNQVDSPRTFPCTKFHLKGGTIFDENRDIFLTNYGMYIDDLSLTIHQDPRTIPETSILTEQIRSLLTMKLQNMKYMFLSVVSSSWKSAKNSDSSLDSISLNPNDPVFQIVQLQQNIHPGSVFNEKLKIFEMNFETTTAVLFETIIQSCPNLQEIILDVRNCDLYTSPLNRLHLLKRLRFNPFEGRIDKLEKLAEFASSAQKEEGPKLLLKDIKLDFIEYNWVPEFSNPSFVQKVVRVLYDILECSKSSLESFSWDGMTLVNGIKFPKVMPKVHGIKLMNPHYLKIDFSGVRRNEFPHLFPRGFSFAKTFPNLRYVCLYSNGLWHEHNIFQMFVSCLNFDALPWVEKVDICWKRWYGPIADEDLQTVRGIFSNATVTHLREEDESMENVIEIPMALFNEVLE